MISTKIREIHIKIIVLKLKSNRKAFLKIIGVIISDIAFVMIHEHKTNASPAINTSLNEGAIIAFGNRYQPKQKTAIVKAML